MVVKDYLKNAGTLLGRTGFVNFLDTQNSNTSSDQEINEDIALFVKAINVVINEISWTYFPITIKEQINVTNNTASVHNLSKSLQRIIAIYDGNKNKVKFKLVGTSIEVDNSAKTIEYSYIPNPLALRDNVSFYDRDIPMFVIIYGVCAEYSLAKGMAEEAVFWHKKYVDCIEEAKLIKNANIKQRSWL